MEKSAPDLLGILGQTRQSILLILRIKTIYIEIVEKMGIPYIDKLTFE